jgi:CRISPR-associated protein Cas2
MEHMYIITYDISDPKRWRQVYGIIEGYGEWLQLSVFQCRLGRSKVLQLEAALGQAINQHEDHVLIMDLGPAEEVVPRVRSMGKKSLPVQRQAVIV